MTIVNGTPKNGTQQRMPCHTNIMSHGRRNTPKCRGASLASEIESCAMRRAGAQMERSELLPRASLVPVPSAWDQHNAVSCTVRVDQCKLLVQLLFLRRAQVPLLAQALARLAIKWLRQLAQHVRWCLAVRLSVRRRRQERVRVP